MSSINLPAGRDLAQEYSKTLSAQMGIMPNLLAAQAQYQPVQSGNTLQNLNYLMLGTPDQTYESQVYTPAVYRQGNSYSYGALPKGITGAIQYPSLPDQTKFDPAKPWYSGLPGLDPGTPGPGMPGGGGIPGIGGGGIDGGALPGLNGIPGIGGGGGGGMDFLPGIGGLFGGGSKPKGPPKLLISPSGYRTVSHGLGAQRGLLSLYEDFIAPSQERITSGQRASDIADVGNLGPGAMQAIMASDPRTAGLIENATDTTGSQYGMGAQLDPSLLRLAQQSVRGRQAGMLGGTGSAGDLGEAMGVSAFGQNLRQQRLGNLSSVVGLRQQFYGDPFQRVLGRPGATSVQNTIGQAGGLQSQGTASNLLNPESSYAQDIYSGNWNALVNAAIGNANNQNALIGAGISAAGQLAGGAMGAMV